MRHDSARASVRSFALLALTTLVGSACGDSDEKSPSENEIETLAPLCSAVVGANPKELFSHAAVAADDVRETIIFGEMDPGDLSPISTELGFRFDDINIPVTAPGDLYVRAIEYSNFLTGWRAGETDYGIVFDVCSVDEDGTRKAAVAGNFAHITALSPDFATMLDEYTFDCQTTAGNDETVETCRHFFPAKEAGSLMIAAGTLLGSAGGTGETDYRAGLDMNLEDTRYPNHFVNPNRLGSEEGPGRAYRYGACVYEYFAEPHRSAYLDKIGLNGEARVSEDAPCGSLLIDEEGTAAGIWIREDMADLTMDDDWVGVLSNLLVLGAHPVLPGQREVISSELPEVATWFDDGILVEFEQVDEGDVNLSFHAMAPGTIYCVSGTGYQSGGEFHYYVELGEDAASLKLEWLETSCADTAVGARAFSEAAISFVR